MEDIEEQYLFNQQQDILDFDPYKDSDLGKLQKKLDVKLVKLLYKKKVKGSAYWQNGEASVAGRMK